MTKHEQKMNRGYWSKKVSACLGIFAIDNMVFTSLNPRELRRVLSI